MTQPHARSVGTSPLAACASCRTQEQATRAKEQATRAKEQATRAKEQARVMEHELRAKQQETATLLHEMTRSDRQWRDMVALLEGQLGEARSR